MSDDAQREPKAPAAKGQSIWDCLHRGELDAALARFRQSLARGGATAADYVGAAVALRRQRRFAAAETVLASAAALFPHNAQIMIDSGWNALDRGDFAAASHQFAAARQREPARPVAWWADAIARRRAGQLDAAERILIEAAERFPDDATVATESGWLALEQQRAADAHARFTAAWQRGSAAAAYGCAVALLRLDRVDEAATFVATCLRADPRREELLVLHAEIAQRQGDWVAAAERWQALLDAGLRESRARSGLGEALLNQGRFDEAEQMLAATAQRFPDDPLPVLLHAVVATRRPDRREARRRWLAAQARLPDNAWACSGLAEALMQIGQLDEAERVIATGLARHPRDGGLLHQHAHLAERSGDWATAGERWRVVLGHHPGDANARRQLQVAVSQARLEADSGGAAAPAPHAGRVAVADSETGGAQSAALMQIESLGDNCEFGLVQRHFAAEPLGLLRWAGIKPAELIAALQSRLAGVGEPEHLEIFTWPSAEYGVRDTRYGMLTHSFVYATAVSREAFRQQQIRRNRYLRDKLLADLAAAEKLFVYKSEAITLPQIDALHAAITQIGPATLLVVRPADAQHHPGSVDAAAERLLLGYIDHFGPFENPAAGMSVACWLVICERAIALHQAGGQPAG